MKAFDETSLPNAANCTEVSEALGGAAVKTLTIFAVPKPFAGSIDQIQRNAFESWKRLGAGVEVLLLGDEAGIAEAADQLDVQHVAGLARNVHGTPLLSSAFALAYEHSSSDLLMYCNSDVILDSSLFDALQLVADSKLAEQFVAFGRRMDVPINWAVDFDSSKNQQRLKDTVLQRGRLAPVVCKEYFAFPRGQFATIPAFAVGRGNWDNWMIHHSRQQGIPVVDLSDSVAVIHQVHDYDHSPGNRLKCYVSGEEAQENQRLAGGKHVISGACGTWRLTHGSLKSVACPSLNLRFWRDLPRFAKLLAQLFLVR